MILHPRFSPRLPSRNPCLSQTKVPRSRQVVKVTANIGKSSLPFDVKDKVQALKEDLKHLFDDKGIDASAYESVVDFKDPITSFNSLEGYLFNIQFLRRAFNPKFELHEIWASDDRSVTTRWTMTMDFTLTQNLPLINQIFKPTIIFTGTSTYVYNPLSGKICKHIDTWDSIQNQEYFSIEGFQDFFKQILAPYTTPDLETPEYTVFKRMSSYEIRRYSPFVVAQCQMTNDLASPSIPFLPTESSSAAAVGAFRQLAGYIFGSNDKKQVMEMTTPVFSDGERMEFVIGPSSISTSLSPSSLAAAAAVSSPSVPSNLPKPLSPLVSTSTRPGGLYAVSTFGGMPTREEIQGNQYKALLQVLERDGIKLHVSSSSSSSSSWSLARYNGPGTPNFLRRNEVLVPLDEEAFFSGPNWP